MKNLKYVLFAFVVFGMLFAVVTLIFYFVQFSSGLSEKTSDWANFGSLLAGVFTLTGSLLTALTLLIIHEENRESQTAREQQSTALTFEQYTSHRALFIDLLNQTASECERKIRVNNPDLLYSRIFSNNNPTHINQYQIDLTREAHGPGGLHDILDRHNHLKEVLERRATGAPCEIFRLYSMLHMQCTDDFKNGDLEFDARHTGINIYHMSYSIQDAEAIINALLRFTGNNPIKTATIHCNSHTRKQAIMEYPIDVYRNMLSVFRSEKINIVEQIYMHAFNRTWVSLWLPKTYRLLISDGRFWLACLDSENEVVSLLLQFFEDDIHAVNSHTIDKDYPDFSHYQNIVLGRRF